MAYPPPAPQPVPVPTPPTPAPAPTPPAPAPVPAPPTPTDLGFPTNTAVAEMTAEQQAAYWQHQSRRHESRIKQANLDELQRQAAELAQLRAATQTEQEKAVAAALASGRAEGLRAAAGPMVDAYFAAATPQLNEQQRSDLLAGLNRDYFLTPDGTGVDTAKVSAYAAQLVPAATAPAPTGTQAATAPRLDTGQGTGPTPPRPRGLEAGAEIARRRHGLPAPGAPTT